jgi:hypothetical protein
VVFCAKVPVFAPKILLYLTQKAHKKGGSSFPTYAKRFGGQSPIPYVPYPMSPMSSMSPMPYVPVRKNNSSTTWLQKRAISNQLIEFSYIKTSIEK